MKPRHAFVAASVLAAGAVVSVPRHAAQAQAKQIVPERQLLGVRLGRPFLEVIRRFGQPSEVQTVALAVSQDQLPTLGGGAGNEGGPGMGMGMGMSPMGMGMPGAGGGNGPGGGMGMMGGAKPFGGGSPFGGGGGNGPGGGIPMMPPAGGGGNGPGGAMGMGMSMGPGAAGAGGAMGGGAQMPEYSNAILWIYKREKNVRLEFLINEDGRVAQISVAAPATTPAYPNSSTSRRVGLGTGLQQVMEAYGYPERHRLLPGLRFYEVYYTKNYHTAFTLDTQAKSGMKVVRITVALAD